MAQQEILLQARKSRGLSQEALAEATGLSLRTIQRIEKGQVKPRPYTLKVLSDLLEIDPVQLLATAPVTTATQPEWPLLKRLNLSILLSLWLPLLSLLFLLRQYRRLRANEATKSLSRKLLSLQLTCQLAVLLFILVLPLISLAFSGSVANGRFPYPLVVYLVYLIINLGLTISVALQFNRQSPGLLAKVPALL